MAVPKFLKTFINVNKVILRTNRKVISGPPGSGEKRVKEGKITKRKESSAGIFEGKPFLNRLQFRERLKKVSGKIPGGGVYDIKERLSIEKELFPKQKFGAYITPYEMNRRIKELKHQLFRSRKVTEKIEIRKKVKFLEKLKGEKKDGK